MKRDNLFRRGFVERKRMPLSRILFFAGFLVFIVVLLIGFRFSGSHKDLQNTAEWALAMSDAPGGDAGKNYLIYGIYEENGELNLDDMFFLNYPPETKDPHVIFIPGEMLLNRHTEIENGIAPAAGDNDGTAANDEHAERSRKERVATFFFPYHFYAEGGQQFLIEQLSHFLGVPIHYFLELDYGGIPEMVDYRGGISYQDDELKGDDYYEYFLRGENDEKPLDRALRRMQDLGGLVDFVGEKKGIFSKSRSIRKASPYLDTNMSWNELEEFYQSLDPLLYGKKEDVITLPGVWRQQIDGEYYYEPERDLISHMMDNLGKELILPRELITVEVLNGSGVTGIAAKVADILREEGFDIVNVDNADSYDYARSHVISRKEEMGPAREVALLIPGAELLKEELEDFEAMITVIVGKNFTTD